MGKEPMSPQMAAVSWKRNRILFQSLQKNSPDIDFHPVKPLLDLRPLELRADKCVIFCYKVYSNNRKIMQTPISLPPPPFLPLISYLVAVLTLGKNKYNN